MPIWKTQSVLQTPEINLNAWRVFEVSSDLWPKITRHFVGYNSTNREGRVSSEIITFDTAEARGVTCSGRVYQLCGGNGLNHDAEYVWSYWKGRNKITQETDVTDEIVRSIGNMTALFLKQRKLLATSKSLFEKSKRNLIDGF